MVNPEHCAGRPRLAALPKSQKAPVMKPLSVPIFAQTLAHAATLALLLCVTGIQVLAQSDQTTAKVLEGHQGAIKSVAFSPDGTQVLTGSWDWSAQLWDVASGREITSFEGHDERVTSVAFSPDGARVLTGSMDGSMRMWDAASGAQLQQYNSQADRITDVAFSPSGRHALAATNHGAARLWDVASGREIRQFSGHEDALTSVAFSPDGTRILTGSADATARIWDTATGAQVRVLTGHDAAVLSVDFSPDGQTAVTGSWDSTTRLWDVETGKQIQLLAGHGASIRSVAFGRDGKTVLTGDWNNTAWICDIETGTAIQSFTGHEASVDAVAYSPDGRQILTGSWDLTARLWPLPQSLWPDLPDAPKTQLADARPAPPLAKPPAKPALPPVPLRDDILVLVIGNRTYAEAPPVEYAHNDAAAFAQLFRDMLGVVPENVLIETDLNSIGMARYFGTDDLPEGKLFRRARFVDEIIVFYSGHGVPVFRSQGLPIGYLLPVDVPAAEPGFGAYPLDMLIRRLENLPVDRVTVLLDACFSGLSNQGSLVPGVSGAFGVAIAAPIEKAKVSVLTATDFQSPQFAHWLPEKQHGAFSWFALEGLRGKADKNADGQVFLSELRNYIDKGLALSDLRQSPSLLPGSADTVLTHIPKGN